MEQGSAEPPVIRVDVPGAPVTCRYCWQTLVAFSFRMPDGILVTRLVDPLMRTWCEARPRLWGLFRRNHKGRA